MRTNCKKIIFRIKEPCCIFFFLFTSSFCFAQQAISKQSVLKSISTGKADLFGAGGGYIENIGQYGDKLPGYEQMGKILYGYEGLGMPVLFTPKGLVHLHRMIKTPDREEMEKEERRKKKKGEPDKKWETINQTITMEWAGANPYPVILTDEVANAYHTYGLLTKKARAFKKLIYKELYPGIDVEYTFIENQGKPGFEYQLIVQPGADISVVKMKYGGDVKTITLGKDGDLIIRSAIDGISQSAPLAFYEGSNNKNETPGISFLFIEKNIIRFKLPGGYNKEKTLVIDPFISGTGNLVGLNFGKAKDIDFDYAGNVYVSGGGDNSFQRLAKFDATGVLQWTFNGSLTVPAWTFGLSYGGWVVEKNTGSIYLGQGLTGPGFSVVRLATTGLYDNYITNPNILFGENWKMIYSCHSGLATIMISGGGGSANNELALLSPPSLNPAASNISGLAGGHNDISDIVIDPLTDEMYTIYSTSINTTGSDCRLYKHLPPYSPASLSWSVLSGFFALREPSNRPYMAGLDNSSNTLAVNSNYLFYSDGKNLKAIDKANGATAGTPLILPPPAVAMQQGGIYADECNNVFVGSLNGTIRVFNFNGSTFDDAAAPDISISGFPANAVYDLAYDNGKNLLYASGNGFVASFDISSYCPATIYAVSVITDCSSLSAIATVTPAPRTGTTLVYVLYDGTTIVASNATGIFTGLTEGVNYTVKAFLNQACGGTQATANFIVTTIPSVITNNPAAICIPATTDLTAVTVTTGSTTGLTYTYWLDPVATIPYATPRAATAGTYYIKGTTVSGCSSITPVTVTSFPSPVADAGNDATICFGKDIQLQGSGGLIYSWSPSTYLNDTTIPDPMVTGPDRGSIIYYLSVTDINGCRSLVDDQVTITVTPPAKIALGFDTTIAINQPLQLNAIDLYNSGLINWLWTPSYGLNNPFIQNPVAILDRDMSYMVTGYSAANCFGTAVIHVKVYKGPEIYVPSAFTPGNNDGLNDVLKAIPVGIKEFHYFSIYNRLGQLVFTTSDPHNGWDGRIQGIEQGSGVFVWKAEGIDYKGNTIFRKGITTVVR